jgi:hypothetical protein
MHHLLRQMPLSAVEYRTLSNSSPSVAIPSGALVEIAGFTAWGLGNGNGIEFTLSNGDVVSSQISGGSTNPNYSAFLPHLILGQKFFSLTQVRIYGIPSSIPGSPIEQPISTAVTLKITPANEIDSADPKTVLVIPEGSTGDYDVVIESSGDMLTWTPMHSQTVSGSGPRTFFRTRIVKR